MAKKRKVVWFGDTPITPVSAKEQRRLAKRVKKRYEKFRRRYKEIHGKVVDWISHSYEDSYLYVSIRFKDKTNFSLVFNPMIVTDLIEFSDMSSGDDEILKTYYRRRDEGQV